MSETQLILSLLFAGLAIVDWVEAEHLSRSSESFQTTFEYQRWNCLPYDLNQTHAISIKKNNEEQTYIVTFIYYIGEYAIAYRMRCR